MKKATIVSASFVLIAAAFAVTVFYGIQKNYIPHSDLYELSNDGMIEMMSPVNYEESQSESVEEKPNKNDSDSVSLSGWGLQGYWNVSAVNKVNQIIAGL